MPAASPVTIRLSIVEDDARELATLTELFRRASGFDVVGTHERPESAWNTLRSENPDLILLDLVYPNGGLSGQDFLLRLRGESRAPKAVAWTVHDDVGHFFNALKAGACGYLLKTTPLDKLPDALRQIYEGELRISPGVARLMLREFRGGNGAGSAGTIAKLAPREETVLELTAQGFSQTEIAAKLGLGTRTVEMHLASVRQKLAAKSNAHAVAIYHGTQKID